MILDREGGVYYAALSGWCEQHSICLMGHPHQSDDIEVEKYFGIPGQDLCLRWIAPEKDCLVGLDSTLGKCSADAARLMHRRRNSNECFGACNKDNNPWQLSAGTSSGTRTGWPYAASTCSFLTRSITALDRQAKG